MRGEFLFFAKLVRFGEFFGGSFPWSGLVGIAMIENELIGGDVAAGKHELYLTAQRTHDAAAIGLLTGGDNANGHSGAAKVDHALVEGAIDNGGNAVMHAFELVFKHLFDIG